MAESIVALLIREKLISPEQGQAANEAATARGTSGVQQLFASGQVNEGSLLNFFAHRFSIPVVRLTQISTDALKLAPFETLRKLRCLPFKIEKDDSIQVAIADPADLPAIEQLKSLILRPVVPFFTTFSSLEMAFKMIGESTGLHTRAASAPVAPPVPAPAVAKHRVHVPATAVQPVKKFRAQDSVVAILNEIITDAIAKGVSDIHIEPQLKIVRVRFRFEGVLFDVFQIPGEQKDPLAIRTKVISNLDISERRVPQDGRTKFKVGDEEINCRVSIMPSLYGETIVLRILRQGSLQLNLEKIGFDAHQLATFRKIISAPNGMVLVTGPTGSGKTTTLYSALASINHSSIKITTVEDPIEYNLEGITQVPINKETGLDFAEVLKSLLRQDPDVMFVGEVRDQETAKVLVQAALTGHLVFSTLHTNDAPSAVLRLLNMGIEPFAVLAAITTVVAQRLVRKVCSNCAKKESASEEQLALLGSDRAIIEHATLMRGAGCDACLGGGYRGRAAIFEVLELDDSLKELFLKGENLIAIKRHAIAKGMKTLRQSALQLVATGTTTLEEAIASTLER